MRMVEPSERNFEIFYSVETEALSLRKAAEKWRLSVVRIQQILEQTRKWHVANTPDWVLSLPAGEQIMVACRMYGQRLGHLRSEAMEAWHASQTPQPVRREVEATAAKPACVVTTTKPGFGQAQYLALAAKLCDAEFNAAQRMAVALNKWQAKAESPAESPEETPDVEEVIVEEFSAADPCARAQAIIAEAREELLAVSPRNPETGDSCDETVIALTERAIAEARAKTPVRAKLEARLRKRQKQKERNRLQA